MSSAMKSPPAGYPSLVLLRLLGAMVTDTLSCERHVTAIRATPLSQTAEAISSVGG